MSELTRRRETLIRSLFTRHGRKKHNLCVCEGVRSCRDLFQSRPDLIEFVVCVEDLDIELPAVDTFRVSRDHLKKLSATEASQGILAVVRKPDGAADDPTDPFIFVLDQVSDPGNFGTILRTARAVGLKEIWFTRGSVDPFNDKVIRSAMASQFVVQLREFADLQVLTAALKRFGYDRIYRTDVNTGNSCFTEQGLFERSAIIMGSEAHGAGDVSGAELVTIPMPGDEESLNVAQAATVILFEYVRRTTAG